MPVPLLQPPTFPLRDTTGSEAAQRAKELHDALFMAYERARDLERQHRIEAEHVNALREQRDWQARQDAAAGRNEGSEYGKVTAELAKATDALAQTPWDARLAGAGQAVRAALSAYEAYLDVDANRTELIALAEAEGARAREELQRSVETVQAAIGDYQGARDSVLSLLPRRLRAQRGVLPPVDLLFKVWRDAEPHLANPPSIEIVPGWREHVSPDARKAAT